MAKFKVGQVVGFNPKFSGNREYHFISGISYREYKNGDRVPVYFVDGDLATKKENGEPQNSFLFEYYLRKLTAREAGR